MKKSKKGKRTAAAKSYSGKDRRKGHLDPIYQRLVARGIIPDRRKGRRKD